MKTAWLAAQKAVAWDKAYKEMRAKYTVLLPAPPADINTASRSANTRAVASKLSEGGTQ